MTQYRAGQDAAALVVQQFDTGDSDTVQALTSAYCRVLAADADMSGAEQQARVAVLAGRVSVAITR